MKSAKKYAPKRKNNMKTTRKTRKTRKTQKTKKGLKTIRKTTRKRSNQLGGVLSEKNIEKGNLLHAKLEFDDRYPTGSLIRAFIKYTINEIEELDKETIKSIYTEWREEEATRRKELRHLKSEKKRASMAIRSHEENPENPKKRSRKSNVDITDSPFKLTSRVVAGVNASDDSELFNIDGKNLFTEEEDFHKLAHGHDENIIGVNPSYSDNINEQDALDLFADIEDPK